MNIMEIMKSICLQSVNYQESLFGEKQMYCIVNSNQAPDVHD